MRAASILIAVAALLPFATAALAVEGDQYWWDGFALPDLDGWVNCATEFEGALVIGGRFSMVGGTAALNIARWDGSQWSPLADGFDAEVLSLAVYGTELVASGRFDHSGASAVRGIARWNGTEWSPLGTGLAFGDYSSGIGASALAVGSGSLYAVGDFNRAGGVETSRIARWNGAVWSALGEGLDGGMAHSVLVLGDSVYVGGSFTTAGNAPASGIALWDGQAWSALGSGLSYASGGPSVVDLITYDGSLIAAGYFDTAGGRPVRNIAAWNGEGWEALGDSPTNGIEEPLRALEVIGDTLIAAGYALHRWDGSAWSNLPPYANGWIRCLAKTHWGLAAGGQFTGLSDEGIAAVNIGIARDGAWVDPSTWTDRMRGLGGFGQAQVTALGSYRGALVASGGFSYSGGPTGRVRLDNLAQWDGRSWSKLGDSPYGYAMSFLARGDTLYAAGTYPSFPYPNTTPVMMFNGYNWLALDTLSLSGTSLAVYRGELYAGGQRMTLNSPTRGGVYRWDGVRWASVGGLEDWEYNGVNSLVVSAGRLFAAGRFDSIAGVPANGIAAWDGTTWSSMDAGLTWVNAVSLTECGGSLYAGGDFRDEVGNTASVVRWDGTEWKLFPGSVVRMNLQTLGCANDQLLAGGFIHGRDFVQHGIVRWDGQDWMSLGSGTNGPVRALIVHDGDLYVGGRFSQAGGHSSSAIARWDLPGEQRIDAMLAAGSGIPNPFRVSTSIALRLAAPGPVRVSVYDLRGRRIAVPENGTRPAGTHIVTWDGYAEDGSEAPAGVYFIRLEMPGHSETRRVVRLR